MSLLVIGGGPAGAAAAITASRAGVDVTILDESRFPRFRPGETLHPGLEPLLASMGARNALLVGEYLRHDGTWVRWGARDEFVPFGEDETGLWRGFQAPREDFDARLLTIARWQPTPAKLKKSEHVSIFETINDLLTATGLYFRISGNLFDEHRHEQNHGRIRIRFAR